MISTRYDQRMQDVNEWLSITEWDQEQFSESALDLVQDQLLKLKLLDEILPSDALLYHFKKNKIIYATILNGLHLLFIRLNK